MTTTHPTNRSHCIEIATFKLKPGVSDDTLLSLEAKIRAGRIRSQPGYISRELAKEEATGNWLMIMRFDTRPQMDAWLVELKSVSEMREMGGLIEMGSMTTQFFNGAEPSASFI
jgi:antibiotic biosynthesis monooxygenase (ABM) superfamily enzyme